MPSFSDSIFLFILALLLFGPKKLPVLARELGKWVGEFRRASNEFKMQMEEELRLSEQEERRKQIAAMEAAAPLPTPIAEPEHPHLQPLETTPDRTVADPAVPELSSSGNAAAETMAEADASPVRGEGPLPIATSGEVRMMPPETGLPTPRSRPGSQPSGLEQENASGSHNALSSLLSAIPAEESSDEGHLLKAGASSHGD